MGKKLSEMTIEELWELFPIILTEHREEWAQWYEEEREILASILPEHALIYHIGSTAIQGIWAKPIVDILVELPDAESMIQAKEILVERGYICMCQDAERISLNKGYTEEGFAEKVFHIHLRIAGDNDEILFRDYLNKYPETAKEYEHLKHGLWKKYEHDRDAYTQAKTDFVRAWVDKAKAELNPERFDIVDELANPTGKTVCRGLAHLKGIPHRTAHVWLLRMKDNRLQILLQKRCLTKGSFPGCFDISSAGHIPAGVDYEESAVRELQEELGIDVRPEELIECGERKVSSDEIFHGKPFHDRQFSKVFCIWKDLDENAFTVQKEELECVRWMDFDACVDAVINNTMKHCIVLNELYMVKAAADANPFYSQD